MRDQRFGIEIEMTGITRRNAAKLISKYFGTPVTSGDYALDQQGRKWKLVYDGSIIPQKKSGGQIVHAGDNYSTEFVSPICTYDDIETIQEIVRKLRGAGAIVNDSTGIHVHVDASTHNANTLRNLTNIMRAKEDILYKALQVDVARANRYCKKVEDSFIERLNHAKPRSQEELKRLWYNGSDGSREHYHRSRYHALNLHSVFQKGTVEFRLFNGTLHAGKIKSYIQLALAINNQALTQKSASFVRTQSPNEKYTFRTWLLRLGMIGKEFETARGHLLEHLQGNIAWKDPAQAEKQKQRLLEQRQAAVIEAPPQDLSEPEQDANEMEMTM